MKNFTMGVGCGLLIATVLLILAALLQGCTRPDKWDGGSVHCPTGNWCDEHGDIVPLPSRPLSQIDVQGHMPACPAGHEVQICGIFGPEYKAQCWVEGCDAR